jgi:hypothetical protein
MDRSEYLDSRESPIKMTSTIVCNGSDYETMMVEKFGKDLTPHRVKYRTLKR